MPVMSLRRRSSYPRQSGYSLIIWDFDGTLADSLYRNLEIFNAMASEHRFLPIVEPDAARKLGTIAFIRKQRIPLLKIPTLVRKFIQRQADGMEQVKLFDDIPNLLQDLRTQNIAMGIVSSNSPANIRRCLAANNVEQHFEFVVGVQNITGKAKALKRVVKRYRSSTLRPIYIGDEGRDVKAAHKAGIDVAAVTWGFHTRDVLSKSKPTYCIDTCSDLRNHLVERQP